MSAIPQVAGVGYLLSDNGTKFQRYDIAGQKWLTPITLASSPGGATASLVDSEGIYVAYDRSVMRYKLDGTTPTHLVNTAYTVSDIHSDGNLLFVNYSSGLYARFLSFSKTTNLQIDSMENYVDSIYGSSISKTANKIFGRSLGISPADITYASYDDAGNFGAAGNSPYHGAYPSASETWVFPTGSKVVDSSGGVYATSDLTRLNSFPSAVKDIAFAGSDVPIVLNGNTLTAYSSVILPTGSKTLAGAATEILVNSTNVIAFNPDAANPNRYTTQIVKLSDLQAPTPGTPVNPVGLAYKPDDIEVASNGSLLILDKETQSIFRWNTDTQQYGATIPLVNVPSYMAYSSVTNTVYLAYASGQINSIDLGAATSTEKPFAILATAPGGLSTAGQYVFAQDGSGAWGTHYTFSSTGTKISAVDWNYYSTEYIWSSVNSKMYFFRDTTSPNDLLWESIGSDGKIGTKMDSPLHNSAGFVHPIRVSPDGKIVILGSGVVHDATTLARQTGGLSNSVSDIAWLKAVVYTMRNLTGNVQFQQWTGATFAPGLTAQVAGTANALLSIADSKLVGIYTPASGVPAFRVMNGSLQVIPPTTEIVIQSENAVLSGGTTKSTGNGGYTGTGYADYGGLGSAVTYSITRAAAGTGKLTFRYANGSTTNRPLQIFVNNALVGTLSFAPTGGWTTWGTVTLDNVSLPSGVVSIRALASTSNGGANVDSLTIGAGTVIPPTTTVTLQSETQALSGGTTQSASNAGYSGTGYADYGGQGSAVTYSTTRANSGTAKLIFRYANGSTTSRPLQIFVNNTLVGTLAFGPTGGWSIWQTISLDAVLLPAGAVTIKAVASTSAGGANVDWLQIS